MKETIISTRHHPTTAPARDNAAPGTGQSVPFSTPGRWAITTTTGSAVRGYLPAWAEDDPSEAGVPPNLLPPTLAGICHRSLFEGQLFTVVPAGERGEAQDEAVFEARITCRPYAPAPAVHVPVVDIEVYPGHWLLGLDAVGVTMVAAKLRAHADRLERDVRSALVTAHADWTAHHHEADPAYMSGIEQPREEVGAQ